MSEDEDDDDEDSPEQIDTEQQRTGLDPTHVSMAVDRSLASKLDNPSIQIHPQHHAHVALDSVQDLSKVFQDLYEEHDSSPRTSKRLAGKPRKDYLRFHNLGDRGDGEESGHAT